MTWYNLIQLLLLLEYGYLIIYVILVALYVQIELCVFNRRVSIAGTSGNIAFLMIFTVIHCSRKEMFCTLFCTAENIYRDGFLCLLVCLNRKMLLLTSGVVHRVQGQHAVPQLAEEKCFLLTFHLMSCLRLTQFLTAITAIILSIGQKHWSHIKGALQYVP